MKRIILVVLFAAVLATWSLAGIKNYDAGLSTPADSMCMLVVSTDSLDTIINTCAAGAKRYDVQRYDTAFSIELLTWTKTYNVKFLVWFSTSDTAATWNWPDIFPWDVAEKVDSLLSRHHGDGSWDSTFVAGVNGWTIFVADTSDTSFLSRAKVSVYTMASSTPDLTDYTDTYGKVVFGEDLVQFIVKTFKAPAWSIDTITLVADGQVDTVYLDFDQIPFPGALDMATLFLVFYAGGSPVRGAEFIVENPDIASDTVNDLVLGAFYERTRTDASGIAAVYVPKSYLYHDSTKALYQATLRLHGAPLKVWSDIWVPDQDSLRLTVED